MGAVSGITTQGNSVNLHTSHSLHTGTQSADSLECLNHALKAFWELESLGITPSEPSVYDDFIDTIRFNNGRYEVRLPWRPTQTRLPSNFGLAKQRFEGLLKRLQHNPAVKREYHIVMQDQLRLHRIPTEAYIIFHTTW